MVRPPPLLLRVMAAKLAVAVIILLALVIGFTFLYLFVLLVGKFIRAIRKDCYGGGSKLANNRQARATGLGKNKSN